MTHITAIAKGRISSEQQEEVLAVMFATFAWLLKREIVSESGYKTIDIMT